MIGPIDEARNTSAKVEKPDILRAALSSATNAAIKPLTMKWSSRSLQRGELPPELTKNRAHLAIYLLPRAFASLGCPMASEFAELWLFGISKRRQIEKTNRPYPNLPLRICRYTLSEFGSSETLKAAVTDVLQRAVDTLPQMASADTALDERWKELRRIAKTTADSNKINDHWSVATPSFIGVLENPLVSVEKFGIRTDTFIANGEIPLSSDAYCAIGPCAARAYLEAVLSKKAGDDRIYVKPTRVGVRIWDDYDFKDGEPDSQLAKLMSKVLGREASQFLGVWQDTDSYDLVVLENSDFQSFRKEFMPVYNSQSPAPTRKLICEDYSSVSDFATRMIAGGTDYPLFSMKA